MFSRAVALLSCRFTSSKRPLDVVSLFTSFYLRSKRYARKKHARLKLKLSTQNEELIIFPFLIFEYNVCCCCRIRCFFPKLEGCWRAFGFEWRKSFIVFQDDACQASRF